MAAERARARSARHAASAVDEVGADRAGQLGRVRRRGGLGDPVEPRVGRRAPRVLRPRDRAGELPVDPRGPVGQHPGAVRRRDRRRDPRHDPRGAAVAARAGVLPAARARDDLHRPVPRHPPADRAVPGRLRAAGARRLRPCAGGAVGHDRDRADLLGVHRRGAARGNGGRAPLAARRGPLARAEPRADAPDRRDPAGRAQGRARAHERLRVAAEGRGAHLGARSGGCRARGADRLGSGLQLHAVHRRGAAVRGDGAADDPPHRLRVARLAKREQMGGTV